MFVDEARGDDDVRFEEHRAYAAFHEQTVYPMMKWQGNEVDWKINWQIRRLVYDGSSEIQLNLSHTATREMVWNVCRLLVSTPSQEKRVYW